ncbi:MAG: radical SAM protein [Thermoplasmata archaeon]|nr:radical SAM protein [Thermoplasmata archaeon]
MEVLAKKGREENAWIYLARFRNSREHLVEFVDSVEPGIPREKKWCINISTQFGCPVNCRLCDAGGSFNGNLTAEELLAQVKYVLGTRNFMRTEKLKVHYARMGEPLLNPSLIASLLELPEICRPNTPMACVATTAPAGSYQQLVKLAEIKDKIYRAGKFQLQFSVNSTDEGVRDYLMPVKKMSLQELAEFGERFWDKSDRKINLNFALARNIPVEPEVVGKLFNPEKFLIKVTPVNPTRNAEINGLESMVGFEGKPDLEIAAKFRELGFEVIVSIGAKEEIDIGSNCGQYVKMWNTVNC